MLFGMTRASRLYCGNAIREKSGRKLLANDLDFIEDGAIVYDQKKIIWVGASSDIPKKYQSSVKWTHLRGKKAIMPGMIDSHTHLVFGGDRSDEFARRCAGATYAEIAAEGGGIQATVQATRAASFDQLFDLALKRAKIAHSMGIRTMECKSGYGLDHATEIRCLQVVKKLRAAFPQMTFVSTYLGAHAIPKEKNRNQYLQEMIDQTLPEIKKKKLAEFVDIFVDEGYYTVAEARKFLLAAKRIGFKLKIHADELVNTESASLAAEVGATSADHLLKISNQGVQDLLKGTIAVLLPGTAYYLKEPYAPARKMLDTGVRVAIATDFNPGSCYSLNLPLMLNLGALHMKMNAAELFAAVTLNAAAAVGLENKKGTLAKGFDSDFVVLPYPTFEEMFYRFGW